MTSERGSRRRAYRLLLHLLPADFRRRFGGDMEALFDKRLRDAGTSFPRRARVWLGAACDLVLHGSSERLRRGVPAIGPGRRRGSVRRFAHDVSSALRSLRKSPGFAAAAVLTLALGIGPVTAVFSVVRGVLLRPLPYRDAGRLVSVWPETNFNTYMVDRVGEEVPALAGVSGISNWEFTLAGDGEAVRLTGSLVSPRHFSVLGVQPALGRAFRPEESDPARKDVVILSHDLWVRRFGADPDILGRSIPLDGAEASSRTVVGVMPAGYRPVGGPDVDLWVPLHVAPGLSLSDDDSWYVSLRVGRLAPGWSAEEATAQLRSVAAGLQSEDPSLPNLDDDAVRTATVRPLLDAEVGDVGQALWLLMAAVGLVLLLSCANVANLLLARGEARRAELAVRRALGAGQERIVRQLLGESLVVALLGGALGAGMAVGGVRMLRALAPAGLPRVDEVVVDPTVLAFTLAASVAAALVSGLAPALRDAGADIATSLRAGGRDPTDHAPGERWAPGLVALQVALALVLAFGAGIMVRSLSSLYSVDAGFEARGVLSVRLSPPERAYGDGPGWVEYYGRVLEAVRRIPGVETASAIHILPQTSSNWSFPIRPEGMAQVPDAPPPSVNLRVVRKDYFRTMEIPVLEGRPIEDDAADDPPVMVVNRSFAETYWPAQDPLDREVQVFPPGGVRYRVVGVVGDVRQFGLDREPVPEMYVSHRQWARVGTMWLVVRTEGEPLDRAQAIRDAVTSVDDQVPLTGMDTLERVVRRTAGTRRFVTALLGAFGLLALVLGAVGVYGVTAFTVGRRVREFGIRRALGAGTVRVLSSALARGMIPVALGVLGGSLVALFSAGTMADLLYGVAPRDPVTLAAVAGVLSVTGLVATAMPALRAGRVDPSRILREE